MNKFKNIYLLAALMVPMAMGTWSCTNEEEDIFDESSAQRLEGSKKEYGDLLCSASNGWIMQYFPSEPEYAGSYVGGYNFHLKFESSHAVTITACNTWTGNEVMQETSVWNMIADDGPVLTFNSYNTLFHFFSDPMDDGRGFCGDYEFIVMEPTADYVRLRGKKWKIDTPMRALPDGVDPVEYMKALNEKEQQVFSKVLLPLRLTTEKGENYDITGLSKGKISFVPVGGDAISETDATHYLITEDGMKFASPYKGKRDSIAIQNFKFNDTMELVCTDADQNAVISIGYPARSLYGLSAAWTVNLASLSGALATAFSEMESSIAAYRSQDKNVRGITWRSSANGVSLQLRCTRTNNITYNLAAEIDGEGKIKLSFNNDFGTNAELFYNNAPGIGKFIDLLCSSAIGVSCNNMLAPDECEASLNGDTFKLTR